MIIGVHGSTIIPSDPTGSPLSPPPPPPDVITLRRRGGEEKREDNLHILFYITNSEARNLISSGQFRGMHSADENRISLRDGRVMRNCGIQCRCEQRVAARSAQLSHAVIQHFSRARIKNRAMIFQLGANDLSDVIHVSDSGNSGALKISESQL